MRLFRREPKPLPKFCPHCGSELRVVETPCSFDPQTGEAAWIARRLECPRVAFDREGYMRDERHVYRPIQGLNP